MAERDDELRARYRALATEEPPAAIDDAIRAAARRAVASAPGGLHRRGPQRWAVPASIAAVLFLSFGVVMRMQQEVPPVSEDFRAGPPVYATPPSAIAPDLEAEAKAPVAEMKKTPEAPQAPAAAKPPAKSAPQARLLEKRVTAPEPAPLAKDAAVAPRQSAAQAPASVPAAPPAPAAAPPAPAAAPPQPKAFTESTDTVARAAEGQRNAAPARRDEAAGASQLAAPREKAESLALQGSPARAKAATVAEPPWPDTAEKKLERIETLRKAGRDREADEALARFKREHPDYRIPDATWERIRPR